MSFSLAIRKVFFTSDAEKPLMLHKNSSRSAQKNSHEHPAMLACDAKQSHVFFDIERCEMPNIRTLAAVWPAIRLHAMRNRCRLYVWGGSGKMGEPPHFGRVWVTKTSILPVFGLKNGPKNSAWIRRNFWLGWLLSIQKCCYFPCFSHIFIKMLKTGEIHTFPPKMSQIGEMLKMHKL